MNPKDETTLFYLFENNETNNLIVGGINEK
jgi:hypothetical protein